MAEVKWIKIATDIFDDEKIMLIEGLPSADSLIVIWFKLLCLAGKHNNDGVFFLNDKIAYTDEMLATIFRRDVNTVRLALKTFEDFGMIKTVEGVITIPNWSKHQNLEKVKARQEYMKKYMQQVRAKQKAICCGSSEIPEAICEDVNNDVSTPVNINNTVNVNNDVSTPVNVNSDVNVTLCEQDCKHDVSALEIDNKDININNIKKSVGETEKRKSDKPFCPPTLEEIQEYCRERNSTIDAEEFLDYNTARGWMIGKNKIKDWKAALRNWERRSREWLKVDENRTPDRAFNKGLERRSGPVNFVQLEQQLLDN